MPRKIIRSIYRIQHSIKKQQFASHSINRGENRSTVMPTTASRKELHPLDSIPARSFETYCKLWMCMDQSFINFIAHLHCLASWTSCMLIVIVAQQGSSHMLLHRDTE